MIGSVTTSDDDNRIYMLVKNWRGPICFVRVEADLSSFYARYLEVTI